MVYRKGERTNQQREREFPFSVDIPIPRDGLGDARLGMIWEASKACRHGAEVWSHSTHIKGELRQWWSRIGTKTDDDAELVRVALAGIGATRTR